MKVLTRNQMKKLNGGVNNYDIVVGTIGGSSTGTCACDIQHPDGTVTCGVSCPVSVCDWEQSRPRI